MKRIVFIIAILIFGFKGFTQVDSVKQKNEIIWLRCCGTLDSTKQPLMIVNGKAYDVKYMNALNANVIQELNIFKGEDATKKYGDRAKYGVIVIAVKKGTKRLKVGAILKKNKINNNDLKLPILFNGYFLLTPYIITEKQTKYSAVLLNAIDYQLKDRKINGKYLLISEVVK